MKKIILLLLMVLPVVIALLAFAIGSFIGRAVKIEFIEDVYVSESNRMAFEQEGFEPYAGDYGSRTFIIETTRGSIHDFSKFFTTVPSKAKFSDLVFEYSNNKDNYNAVEIKKDGKLYINKNRRSSDSGFIIIQAKSGSPSPIFTLYIDIKLTDETRLYFDYFGYDYRFGNTVSISADLDQFITNGLDTAPYDLFYIGFAFQNEFLDKLFIENIEDADYSLTIGKTAKIRIEAEWNGKTLETFVYLEVVA